VCLALDEVVVVEDLVGDLSGMRGALGTTVSFLVAAF